MISITAFGAAILLNLSIDPWRAINDGVMGGVSSGGMSEFDEGLRFEGSLSLENNGGFASVRRALLEDLSNTKIVRIVVRGDGRRYQLRLHQQGPFEGVSWTHSFDTRSEWQALELYYSDFKPMYRGRPVPAAGPLEPQSKSGYL